MTIKEKIIKVMKDDRNRPIPPGIITRKMLGDKPNPKDKKEIYQEIDSMIEAGELRQLTNGKVVVGYVNGEIDTSVELEGVIHINSKGDGFIRVDNKQNSDWYVNKRNINGALNGDKVKFNKMEHTNRHDLGDAVITEVVEHEKDFFVGMYVVEGDGYRIDVDDPKMYLKVQLDTTEGFGLVDGTKFLFKIHEYGAKTAIAAVSRVIGHRDDVGTDILSIVYNNGIEPNFDEAVIEEADKIKLNITEKDKKDRKDITSRNIVTIDPASSKDLDDSFNLEILDNGNYMLSVSIADVSHYVKLGTALDESARDRGTSVYLVDRVIPMLPHNISNNVCSLNPNVKRLALTCDIEIDDKGLYKNIDVFPSIIENKRRFAYGEVNDFFKDATKLPKDTEETKKMLTRAKELHDILRAKKKSQGFVNFEIKEPNIIVDEKCKPIDILIKERGEAQMMIEDFMIAANEAVTLKSQEIMLKHGDKSESMPFLYRVHNKPEIRKLHMFEIEAKKLNFTITHDFENILPKTISSWLDMNPNFENEDLINKMLLRSMAKAKYDTKNTGHFGLASNNYTHFTSPIRRYPDLMIHRLFWMYDFTPEDFSDDERNKFKSQLQELCVQSSDREVRAVRTERDVNAEKFTEYMATKIGEEFDGVVSTVSSFGIFIELPNTIEGLIRINNISDDYYNFNPETLTLTGRSRKRVFTLGTKVKVRVASVSVSDHKIDFEIVGLEPKPRQNNNRGYSNKKSSFNKY